MEDHLLAQNLRIKEEANILLNENGLFQILGEFGKPYISGSYALDLMTWRDLDIYLETESITPEQFFRLGGELCMRLSPPRMQFRNELQAKTEGLPDGLYWGIYLGDERNGGWKIDVWAVRARECKRLLDHSDGIREQLDDESSAIILSIKSQCWQDPDYRRRYSSTDIYEAVLKGGVRNLEDFWKYIDL